MSTKPLRDPQDGRLPQIARPCAMALFDVTGSLGRKKVMPALYDLAKALSLVGFGRSRPGRSRPGR